MIGEILQVKNSSYPMIGEIMQLKNVYPMIGEISQFKNSLYPMTGAMFQGYIKRIYKSVLKFLSHPSQTVVVFALSIVASLCFHEELGVKVG